MIRYIKYVFRFLLLLFNSKNIKVSFFSKINFQTKLEGRNRIGRNVGLYSSKLGFGSYISKDCEFSYTLIGRYCSIGKSVKTIHGLHPTSVHVSTHPAFFSTLNQTGFYFAKKDIFVEDKKNIDGFSIVVGNDVWIGNDVRIMEGVTIGDGAIIGACALVTKDVQPYAIVVGVPARVVRYRFEEETIKKLLKLKWWDWSFKRISDNAYKFNNFSLLLDK